ncbi:nucleoside-diphosphate sugar epimerase/dehydratase [Bacillus sp. ISL-55]|uniref:polysaccharide biosynthesis protein n=1 Tax=Bacillus sp. ISL-55 TaxID=2819134 RepID=UPI001BECD197|nr:nucleoside-diphosphate sugar epimerase/dehydratase [Bacillus sp. ISL-55]MBT2692666.1 polysaccharide biosynthesis protein [Bacillus sp. ISL-55]
MRKRRNRLMFMISDMVIISLSVVMSFYILMEGNTTHLDGFSMFQSLMIVLPVCLLAFVLYKVYHRLWKYASIIEAMLVFKAVSLAVIISFLVQFLLESLQVVRHISPAIYLLFWLFILTGIFTSRFIFRYRQESRYPISQERERALIVGAGDAGMLVAKELKNYRKTLLPVAMIDDNSSKQSMRIFGIPIVGGREEIPLAAERYQVHTIVIAMPSASKREIAEVVNICKKTKCNVKILPRVSDIIDGKVSVNRIRDVEVEDLLGRDPSILDLQGISEYLESKTVLVTGAGGSIGSELCRQLTRFKVKELIMLGHGENSIYQIKSELVKKNPDLVLTGLIGDIQDRKRVNSIFRKYKPQIVFHAAAHKHVPIMEDNPLEAIKNNVLGTRNLAEAADAAGTERFVQISTDKAVRPTSIMGATKRTAEMVIQAMDEKSHTNFCIVRFGNVLGSRGSVVPLFKKQIREGGPVTLTHPDMVRYFMTIPEAVQLVIQAGAFVKGGELFLLDMGEPVKIKHLAETLISLSGLEPGIDIELKYTGIRPGEKLYEELLTAEEEIQDTEHHLIFRAKNVSVCDPDFFSKLKKLEDLAEQEIEDSNLLLPVLKSIVPTYQPNK